MNSILNMILMIPGMLIAFTFHEYAHAYVADKLGDKTPRFQGRLTLNPIAHIDPIGFIAVLIFSFGWAKPHIVIILTQQNHLASQPRIFLILAKLSNSKMPKAVRASSLAKLVNPNAVSIAMHSQSVRRKISGFLPHK